jgi:hypothetical protein
MSDSSIAEVDGAVDIISSSTTGLTNVVSIAALRLLGSAIDDNDSISVLGYYAEGDGGGGTFYWDATSTDTDNGGTIIQATGVTTGRWIRVYSGSVNVLWFGAKTTTADNSTTINTIITLFYGTKVEIFIPVGVEYDKNLITDSSSNDISKKPMLVKEGGVERNTATNLLPTAEVYSSPVTTPVANEEMVVVKNNDTDLTVYIQNRLNTSIRYLINDLEVDWDVGLGDQTVLDLCEIRTSDQDYYRNYAIDVLDEVEATGTWNVSSSYRWSSTAGDYVQVPTVNAYKINFQYLARPDGGIANIYANNELISSIDMYAATNTSLTTSFITLSRCSNVKLVVTNTKNASSTGYKIYLYSPTTSKVLRTTPEDGGLNYSSTTLTHNKVFKTNGTSLGPAFQYYGTGNPGETFLGIGHGSTTQTSYSLTLDGIPVSDYTDGQIIKCKNIDVESTISIIWDNAGTPVNIATMVRRTIIRGTSFRIEGSLTFLRDGDLSNAYFNMLSMNNGITSATAHGVGNFDEAYLIAGLDAGDPIRPVEWDGNDISFYDDYYANLGLEFSMQVDPSQTLTRRNGANSAYLAYYHSTKTKGYIRSDKNGVLSGDVINFGANYKVSTWG